jgi:hypothetical protein
VAARAVRETLKLVYNLTLQGEPVGPQEGSTRCPLGGSGRVFGVASSNPLQGATEVTLTYVLTRCSTLELDSEPPENYELILDGTFEQTGILAVQPTATTALLMRSDAVSLEGSVYDPPLQFRETSCVVELVQSGNQLSGTLCGRRTGLNL